MLHELCEHQLARMHDEKPREKPRRFTKIHVKISDASINIILNQYVMLASGEISDTADRECFQAQIYLCASPIIFTSHEVARMQ